jgi:hypothetical protein
VGVSPIAIALVLVGLGLRGLTARRNALATGLVVAGCVVGAATAERVAFQLLYAVVGAAAAVVWIAFAARRAQSAP